MASDRMSLNDFPVEVIMEILSYLGPEDIIFNFSKLGDGWGALAKDKTIWKKLTYKCDRSSDFDRVCEVLRVAPALLSLNIRDRKDVALIVGVLCESRVDIRKIVLKNCNVPNDDSDIVTNIVTLYPDLEVLSLEGCFPRKHDAYFLIPRLKHLSELNLSGCEGLNWITLGYIADSCQHLKKLSLGGMLPFLFADAVHVFKKLGKQLTTLVLHQDISDVAYLSLNNCARLQELKIKSGLNMTDRGLLEGIGSLQQLKCLRLSKCYGVTARALSTFLDRPSMTSIVFLDLTKCSSLDDEGLKGIAKRCVLLKELAVTGCSRITDSGIRMVICNCNQLRVLNLCGAKLITGDGWLPQVPAHLPQLRLLCLTRCDSECDKYIAELVAAAPKLLVITWRNDIVGAERNEQLKITDKRRSYKEYDIIRQWALAK